MISRAVVLIMLCFFFPLVDSTANHDILQECLEGLNISPETGTPISSAHLVLTFTR